MYVIRVNHFSVCKNVELSAIHSWTNIFHTCFVDGSVNRKTVKARLHSLYMWKPVPAQQATWVGRL